MTAPLLAVDTPSMLFRAFYALPRTIVGPDGAPVNALLGAANLIVREVEVHGPRAVVLCFGPDAATYRTELYPAYHAGREELLAFKEIATLRDAGIERPPDRPTDWAGAAAAARERGMNRLAERLESAG